MRRIVFVLLISALLFIVGCGGSSSSSRSSGGSGPTSTAGGNPIAPSANNVAPLIVDAGPSSVATSNEPDFNMAFTTVTVCAPSSPTTCATIDHVMVDTGSSGLRIPASVLSAYSPNILTALQNVSSNLSTPVAECIQFLDNSYFWGTVRLANVEIGGASNNSEVASNVPIHVMGDTSIPTAPSSCSQVEPVGSTTTITGTEEDTVLALGANGLLGVGTVQYDCDTLGLTGFGIGSSNPCASGGTPPPGMYYTCPSSGCSESLVSATEQVRNPVSLFPTDNNGVILEFAAVPVGVGGTNVTGSLVFGIGTQSNNGLGSATVLTLDTNINDPAWAGFTTVYNGVSYPNSTENNTLLANGLYTFGSFLDSGSSAFYFLDQPQSGITTCGDWYCPNTTESLTATNRATGGKSSNVQFNVSNADTLPASATAYSDLAAPHTSGTPDALAQAADGYFDWGLPFFYGRNVYTAIWGANAPTGVPAGPFWAY